MGTCAYNGEVGPKNWSQGVYVQNGSTLTAPLKDLPGLLILKIFNIIGIYARKFFPVNIEHCSPITMFMNGKTLRFVLCFSGFILKIDLYYPFFKMGNMIRLHYGTFIAYFHIFSFFSKIFYSIFSFIQL